jgi:hypothetical protein
VLLVEIILLLSDSIFLMLVTLIHDIQFLVDSLMVQGALDDCELSLARDPNYVKVLVVRCVVSAMSLAPLG